MWSREAASPRRIVLVFSFVAAAVLVVGLRVGSADAAMSSPVFATPLVNSQTVVTHTFPDLSAPIQSTLPAGSVFEATSEQAGTDGTLWLDLQQIGGGSLGWAREADILSMVSLAGPGFANVTAQLLSPPSSFIAPQVASIEDAFPGASLTEAEAQVGSTVVGAPALASTGAVETTTSQAAATTQSVTAPDLAAIEGLPTATLEGANLMPAAVDEASLAQLGTSTANTSTAATPASLADMTAQAAAAAQAATPVAVTGVELNSGMMVSTSP